MWLIARRYVFDIPVDNARKPSYKLFVDSLTGNPYHRYVMESDSSSNTMVWRLLKASLLG